MSGPLIITDTSFAVEWEDVSPISVQGEDGLTLTCNKIGHRDGYENPDEYHFADCNVTVTDNSNSTTVLANNLFIISERTGDNTLQQLLWNDCVFVSVAWDQQGNPETNVVHKDCEGGSSIEQETLAADDTGLNPMIFDNDAQIISGAYAQFADNSYEGFGAYEPYTGSPADDEIPTMYPQAIVKTERGIEPTSLDFSISETGDLDSKVALEGSNGTLGFAMPSTEVKQIRAWNHQSASVTRDIPLPYIEKDGIILFAVEELLAESATSQIYLLDLLEIQGPDKEEQDLIAAAYQSYATQTNTWKQAEPKHYLNELIMDHRIISKLLKPSPEELARQAYEEEVASWDINDDPFVGYLRALYVAMNGSGDDGWVETSNNIRGASFDTSVNDKDELQWEVNTALHGSLVESDTAGEGVRVFERSLETEDGDVTVTLHYHEPTGSLFAPMYTFESAAGTLTFIDVDLERNVSKGDSVITPHDNVVTTRQSFLMLPADAGTNIDGSPIRTPFLNAAMGETHLFSEAVLDLMAEYSSYPSVQFPEMAVVGE